MVPFGNNGMVMFFCKKKKRLAPMVFWWFLGHSTITIKWFSAPRSLLSMFFCFFFDPTMRWFRWIVHLYWNSPGSLLSPVHCLFVFLSFCLSVLALFLLLQENIYFPTPNIFLIFFFHSSSPPQAFWVLFITSFDFCLFVFLSFRFLLFCLSDILSFRILVLIIFNW